MNIAEKKWDDFFKWLKNHADNWIFRGVSDKDKHLLVPSIGRLSNYSLENEMNLFKHFQLKSTLLTSKTYDEIEWLVMAQHHGLPTRLLDWTTNPLVAAFFAVKSSHKNEIGRIYAAKANINAFTNRLHRSPFEIKDIEFLVPPVSTKRIELQKGLFSIHPVPNKPAIIINGSLVNYDISTTNCDVSDIIHSGEYTFDIPFSCKLFFEQNIRAIGIDENIFGDLDGIAKNLSYQLNTGRLPKIVNYPDHYTKEVLEGILELELVKYYKFNEDEFPITNPFLLCVDKFEVAITGIYPKKYSPDEKRISGLVWVNCEPNLRLTGGIIQKSISFTNEKLKKYNSFYNKLNGSNKTFFNNYRLTLRFDIEFISNIDLDKAVWNNFDLSFYRDSEDEYKQLISLASDFIEFFNSISTEEKDIIERCPIDSNEIIDLIKLKRDKSSNI